MVDWDNLPDSQIAAVCGRDPMMWAEAFCHAAKKIGVDLGDDPEGLMVGWFSAAMQAETDHMTPEQHEHEAREQRRVKCLHQMGDIVERLRDGGVFPMTFGGPDVKDVAILYDPMTPTDAIKEIERLRKECEDHITRARTFADGLAVTHTKVDGLRAALLKIANLEYGCVDDTCEAPIIAVAALEGKDG